MDNQSGHGNDETPAGPPAAPDEPSVAGGALPDPASDHDAGDAVPATPPVVGWETGVQWEAVDAAAAASEERRPLRVGSAFGRTLDMFLRHPLVFIVLAVPGALVGAVSSALYAAPTQGAATLGIALITIVVGLVLGLAMIIASDEFRAGRPVEYGSVLRRAGGAAVTAVLSAIAQYLALFGLILLAAIVLSGVLAVSSEPGNLGFQPGLPFAIGIAAVFVLVVYIGLRWSLTNAAIALEGAGPLKALGRSRFLTKGNLWRIFGLFLAIGLMTIPLSLGLGMLAFASDGSPVVALLTAAAELVTVPIFSIGIAIVFGDLTGRPEATSVATTASTARVPFVAGLILIGVVATAVAIPQLGSAVERLTLSGVPVADRGKLVAGTTRNPLDPCRPIGVKSTFASSDSIYIGGYFTKAIAGGQQGKIDLYVNGALLSTAPLGNASGSVACYYESDPLVGGPPGTYRLVVSLNGETIAEGSFAIQ